MIVIATLMMIKQWSEFAKGAHGKGCTAASGNLGTCFLQYKYLQHIVIQIQIRTFHKYNRLHTRPRPVVGLQVLLVGQLPPA